MKVMYKFPLLVILMIALTSCNISYSRFCKKPIVRDYESDAFTRVSIFQANSVAHKWRWYLEDGWILYDSTGLVKGIKLRYRTQNILELQQARAKLVDFVEEFMTHLESDPEALGNLSPDFTVDNLNVYVDFQSYWGMYGDPMYIGWMVLENGMAYYYNFDVKLREIDYWYSRIESYAKSKEVVRLEREAEENYKLNFSEAKCIEVQQNERIPR